MPTLLIVEDDSSLRTLYETEFREDGYTVTGVGSGEEALAALEKARPEVVVLDIRLSGMDGLELLRSLLERKPEIGVILNSAYPAYKQDFTSWSADGYVVKSSDLGELKNAVARAVQRRTRAA